MATPQAVIFELNQSLYGVEVEFVERLEPETTAARLPKSASWLFGIAQTGCGTRPVVDLRTWLELPAHSLPCEFILVQQGEYRIAIRVDHLHGIVGIPDQKLLPMPVPLAGKHNVWRAIFMYQDRPVALFDVPRLVGALRSRLPKIAA